MKKIFITISFIFPILLSGAPIFVFAQSATDTIVLPPDLTGNILTQATALLGSLGPYIELIIGVLLALVVVEYIISAIRGR